MLYEVTVEYANGREKLKSTRFVSAEEPEEALRKAAAMNFEEFNRLADEASDVRIERVGV